MYCTVTDIRAILAEETLRQLTDDDNIGIVDEAKIQEAIDNAGATVDGFGAGRYQVPFEPPTWFEVPRVIKAISLDLAVYNLYSRRENVPELRKERYQNSMKLLDRLADGKLTIGAQAKPQTSGGAIVSRSRAQIFTPAKLDTF